MSSKSKRAVAVWLLLLSSAAHSEGLLAVGYGKSETAKGAEIELGLRKTSGDWAITVIPLGGILYRRENSRYRSETMSNGTEVCRDTTNGQFADKENCSSSGFQYAARIGVDYALASNFSIGVGGRFAKGQSDAYASLGISLGQKASLQVRGGGKYFAAALTTHF